MVRKILMSAMVMLLLFTLGCENQPNDENNKPPENKTAQVEDENKSDKKDDANETVNENSEVSKGKEKTLQIKIYYPDDAGMNLVGVNRQIKFAKEEDKYFAAVKLLLDAPK